MVQSGSRQQAHEAYRGGAQERNTRTGTRGGKELQIVNVQRNPYLMEYDVSKKTGSGKTVKSKAAPKSQTAPKSRATPKSQEALKRTQVQEIDWVNDRALKRAAEGGRTVKNDKAPGSGKTARGNRAAGSVGTAGNSRTAGYNPVGKMPKQDSKVMELPISREVRTSDYRRQQMRNRRAAERRRRQRQRRMALLLLGCVCSLLLGLFLYNTFLDTPEIDGTVAPIDTSQTASGSAFLGQKIQGIKASDYYKHPTWTEDFLTVNEYSRPGDALKEVNSIFVHYTANKGTSAAQNRSYFEQLKDTHERSASAHFIIGYEGEIIQCVPLDEIAYAVMGRNEDSISIECCYNSEDGSFTQETYDSLLAMLKWLTDTYNLDTEDILRHYDCGGKKCPVYYVEHEDAWEQLKEDVGNL